jgi:hypothetical protein
MPEIFFTLASIRAKFLYNRNPDRPQPKTNSFHHGSPRTNRSENNKRTPILFIRGHQPVPAFWQQQGMSIRGKQGLDLLISDKNFIHTVIC